MQEHEDLLDAFIRTREALLRQAESVPPDLRTTPFVGHWNLMDVLAHLVGWDYTNLQAIEEFTAGRVPAFYKHFDPGWAAYNQQLVDRYGSEDWTQLRQSLRQSQEAVRSRLRRLSSDEMTKELSEPGRRRPVTLAAIVRAAIRDEREHLEQLRTFIASRTDK